jgi:hypothetical protein
MTTLGEVRGVSADRSFGTAAGRAKPDNIWVETAWTVLEAANDLDDETTIEACQRVIDDDSDGELPAQSDMNIILGFWMSMHTKAVRAQAA